MYLYYFCICICLYNKMNLSDRLFRKKVERLYPHIAEEIARKPLLTDAGQIPLLYARFKNMVAFPVEKGSEFYEFQALFIGVILTLYDPDYLADHKKKVVPGMRDELARLFEVDGSTISWWISQIKGRMRIYKDFDDNVQRICDRLKSSLKE